MSILSSWSLIHVGENMTCDETFLVGGYEEWATYMLLVFFLIGKMAYKTIWLLFSLCRARWCVHGQRVLTVCLGTAVESLCFCLRRNMFYTHTHTSWQATSAVNKNSCFTCFYHIHQETHLRWCEYLLTWLSCLLKCFKRITRAIILISSTGCTPPDGLLIA